MAEQWGPGQQQQLLQEIQQRITELRQAIQRVMAVKRQLQHNAQEVKSQIHWTMSRQLETLRAREVWLLQQVELVQQTKDDVLRLQKDRLYQALGGLSNYLECAQDGEELGLAAAEKTLVRHMSDSLDRLDEIGLDPEESANISFQADLSELQLSIQRFGRVDSRMLPMDRIFARPDSDSASLPRMFEDYDDAEHHVLYKTVQELRGSKENVIEVAIPLLSERPQDWLLQPAEAINPLPKPDASQFLFAPFKRELSEWLTKAPASGSLQQWLQDLQQDTAQEDDEDDFELLSNTNSSSVSHMLRTHAADVKISETTPVGELSAHFQRVLGTSGSSWLLPIPVKVDTANYMHETLRYFREISNDTKDWLIDYEQKQEPVRIHSSSLIDIEDLRPQCESPQLSYFCTVPSDTQHWLLRPGRNDDADEDEGDSASTAELARMCRANEMCQSFDDCVCDENCKLGKHGAADVNVSRSSENAGWLYLGQSVSCHVDVPTIIPNLHRTQPGSKAWLYPGSSSISPLPFSVPSFSMFTLAHTQHHQMPESSPAATANEAGWLNAGSTFCQPAPSAGVLLPSPGPLSLILSSDSMSMSTPPEIPTKFGNMQFSHSVGGDESSQWLTRSTDSDRWLYKAPADHYSDAESICSTTSWFFGSEKTSGCERSGQGKEIELPEVCDDLSSSNHNQCQKNPTIKSPPFLGMVADAENFLACNKWLLDSQ